MIENDQRIVSLDVANFDETVQGNGVVVIDISADWCGPCQAFTEVFDETAASNDDVIFARIDVDAQPELNVAFGVTSIPTIAVMRGGALIFLHEGTLSAPALDDVIRQARALDLDQIRDSVEGVTAS